MAEGFDDFDGGQASRSERLVGAGSRCDLAEVDDSVGRFSNPICHPLDDDVWVLAVEVVGRRSTTPTRDRGESGEDARREHSKKVNGQQADERERCCGPCCKCCSIGCSTCDGGAVVVVRTAWAAGNGPPAMSTHSVDVEDEEEKEEKSSSTMHTVGLHR